MNNLVTWRASKRGGGGEWGEEKRERGKRRERGERDKDWDPACQQSLESELIEQQKTQKQMKMSYTLLKHKISKTPMDMGTVYIVSPHFFTWKQTNGDCLAHFYDCLCKCWLLWSLSVYLLPLYEILMDLVLLKTLTQLVFLSVLNPSCPVCDTLQVEKETRSMKLSVL